MIPFWVTRVKVPLKLHPTEAPSPYLRKEVGEGSQRYRRGPKSWRGGLSWQKVWSSKAEQDLGLKGVREREASLVG